MRLLVILLFLYSLPVLSHQSSLTSGQKEIKWNFNNVPVRVLNTSSSLPSSLTYIDQAIAEWNGVSSFNIQRVNNSTNQIKFLNDFSKYGSAVIGVTEVSYSTSGQINSANILLNEENYNFKSTPGISLGNTVYLKDVVTHELGHFVGLNHTEVLNASMFYQNFPGQSELSADDIAGIRNKYDSGYGKIYGYVKGGNHIGVLGVNVQAISRTSGESISDITDENGLFEIKGLDIDDTYYLYTSPIKNLSALPSFYANVQTGFCPTKFVSSFFSKCGRNNDGIAQGISLTTAKKTVNVGVVSINCSLRIQEDYVNEKLQSTFDPLEVFNYTLDPRLEKTHVGYFTPSVLETAYNLIPSEFTANETLTIDLSDYDLSGAEVLKLRLISQSLGNAVEYEMDVSVNGNHSATYTKSIFPANTYNLDLEAFESLDAVTANNKFQVTIRAKKLSTSGTIVSIPDFTNFGSVQNLPYLLVMSIESPFTGPLIDTGAVLSDNSFCLDAPFTFAVKNSTAQSDETAIQTTAAAATCGTIEPPSGPGSGPGQYLVLLSLGFLLSLLPSRLVRSKQQPRG